MKKIIPLLLGVGVVLWGVGLFRAVRPSLLQHVPRLPMAQVASPSPIFPREFSLLWISDFHGNRIFAVTRAGEKVWEQQMASAPIPSRSANVQVEYVTLAPNGNLIVADGEGMMVQEIDRATHKLLWQYGVRSIQGFEKGFLHQPDKAYKINDHEVLMNDGNNRRVIIVDQRTNDIVWQYGKTLVMGSAPGLLRGNTFAAPIHGGREILITDTLEKKILLVDRATKNIVWEWKKPDAKWLQHVFPTPEGTFVLEDRQKQEVFEVNRQGHILWTITTLTDGSRVRYPTDIAKLDNGHVLIALAGSGRIVEILPKTGEVVWEYGRGKPTPGASTGFPTAIALDRTPS